MQCTCWIVPGNFGVRAYVDGCWGVIRGERVNRDACRRWSRYGQSDHHEKAREEQSYNFPLQRRGLHKFFLKTKFLA